MLNKKMKNSPAKKSTEKTSYQKKDAARKSAQVGATAGTSVASGHAGKTAALATKSTVKKSVSTVAKVESRRKIGKGIVKGLTGVEKTVKISFVVVGIVLGVFFLCGMIYLALAIRSGNPDAARRTVFGLSSLPLQRFYIGL